MCGIVGLFLKKKRLEPELGAHLSAMLAIMSDRGPDSAGVAIYGPETAGHIKLTLQGQDDLDWEGLAGRLGSATGADLKAEVYAEHAVFAIPSQAFEKVLATLEKIAPEVSTVSAGRRMEIFKGVGLPANVSRHFNIETLSGTHGIGHTRMATESAVTIRGAHPFSTGLDQCLVHNGSLSNHNSIRRTLVREGLTFQTENDSEVAAGYLTWQMRKGHGLDEALQLSLCDLDGFYTFVVGTESGFGVLRDPIACKPAAMAETDDYVAFGSEYRALAVLPGIENARVWEPEPAKVYFWQRGGV